MKLKTTYKFNGNAEDLWPLLFGSKMDDKKPCRFLFGLPKPVECRLEDGQGGIGEARQCISDKGIIQQRILEWQPNKKLSFEMAETDIYFGPCVDSIVESFELNQDTPKTTYITRTTEFKLNSNNVLLIVPMYIGLKSIHKYVFGNWDRIINENRSDN